MKGEEADLDDLKAAAPGAKPDDRRKKRRASHPQLDSQSLAELPCGQALQALQSRCCA